MTTKVCVICGREFESYDKPISRCRGIGKRPCNAVTCSKNCARKYQIYNERKRYEKRKQELHQRQAEGIQNSPPRAE